MFKWLIQSPELLNDRCVLSDDVCNILCGASEFGAYEDESHAEVSEFLALHVHVVPILVRLEVVLHHVGRQSLKLDLINVRELVEQLAHFLTGRDITDI